MELELIHHFIVRYFTKGMEIKRPEPISDKLFIILELLTGSFPPGGVSLLTKKQCVTLI